jgi:RNA polymerase sigma factor (sigma-70 family)
MALDFATFYDKHIDAVYRFVYFRVGQKREVAEDLTSDIFMSALEAFDRFDPARGEKAWIMTIARNKVINHWRDRKENVDIDDVAFTLVGEEGMETATSRDETATLKKAMDELKAPERSLIEKKYLLGYHYEEIAESIGKKAGAVRVETHRAMKKLKGYLKGKL